MLFGFIVISSILLHLNEKAEAHASLISNNIYKVVDREFSLSYTKKIQLSNGIWYKIRESKDRHLSTGSKVLISKDYLIKEGFFFESIFKIVRD